MNMRRLPIVMALTVSAWAVACSDTPKANDTPQPSATSTGDVAPTTSAAPATSSSVAAATTSEPAKTSEPVTPPPAAKPGKEKIVGKWQFAFEGEPRAKAEEEGKKKFAKEKDTKKFDAFMKQHEDEAAGEWIEFTADSYVSHVTEKGKDKVVLEVKYDVVKDDNTSITTKAKDKEKPKVGKIDPKVEIVTVFKDDNTIEMMDPVKKMKLVFKRK